ncbi:nucleoporin 62 like [Amia ocellicauda]|uniref:nucleoporin 62 like n=1 Tax=Amia ocellicauda TaxID=2972642 RepID=UPI00346456E2
MSGFNFGSAASGGFSFGTPKTTAGVAPANAFGAPAVGGGFAFGTPAQPQPQPQAQPPAATSLFSMPAQGNAATQGGFSFGTPAQTSATGTGFAFSNSTPKLSLNMPTTSQPSATGGLSMGGGLAPSTGSGFAMGGALTTQSTMAPSSGGFSFGMGTGGLGGATLQAQAQAQLQPQVQVQPQVQAQAQAQAQSQPQPQTQAMGGFSLGGGTATTATSQPTGGFSFGAAKMPATAAMPVSAPATSSTGATMGGGFSFGNSAAMATSQPTATPTLSLGGQTTGLTLGSMTAASTASVAPGITSQGTGFSFGAKPTAAPAAATTTPAPQAVTATGSSLFSAPPAASSAANAFNLGSVATTPAMTSVGGGLGFMLKPLGATSTPSTAATVTSSSAATVFSLGLKSAGAPAVGTMASSTATITATTATTASAPPVMSYTQLEALINKWSLELEDQERHFLQQATQVNAWDRVLIENGEKITCLHREVEKVKLDQRRLDQELDFILSQQKELEDLLSPLEESVKEQNGTIYMQNADEERERTYKLAENVDAQLKRMSQDLKEIIEHLNTSSGPADTSDPLQQICKILNAHMDSLQWIDQNSVLLQRRVEEVSKLCDSRRKEQEKSFRITFD